MAAENVVLEFQDCIQALGRECSEKDVVSAKSNPRECDFCDYDEYVPSNH